jgi:hypothetical protein
MSLRIPQPDLFDKILRSFGKRRALFIPQDVQEAYRYDFYLACHKENFFKVLFRPRNAKLPEGYENLYSLEASLNNHSED